MRTFGNYVLFVIISVLGMMLAANGNEDFKTRMLNLHNEYRIKHGAPKLDLDEKLSEDAMKFANNLINGKRNPRGENWPYGTNIFSAPTNILSYKKTAEQVFFSWYNNGKGYDYSAESPSHTPADYFTQIVWKSTKKLGLALLMNDFGSVLVVATYFPPGNENHKYADNVIKPEL